MMTVQNTVTYKVQFLLLPIYFVMYMKPRTSNWLTGCSCVEHQSTSASEAPSEELLFDVI